MKRPGFLSGTSYWFANWSKKNNQFAYYAPDTVVPWYEEFWVEEPTWEKYLKN